VIDKLCIVFLALVVASCAASLPYATNYPMTDVVVNSRDGVLHGKIPQGWFSATEDSLGSGVTLILIHDTSGATLTVTPVILDFLALHHIQSHGLILLAGISASARSKDAGATLPEPQEFELRGKKFCSYEITSGNLSSRIVVFSVKGKYYECEVRGGANDRGKEELARLFTTQQSFLSSLEF
jgi:hypothetical protein